MSSEFSRILTLLRKEKGISQKSAAESLGVSQALLSHYEKGIRECGLDFLVRAADFYEVSCDYMLGRTPDRNGSMLTIDELPDVDENNKDKIMRGNILTTLNKKLIINSVTVMYDMLMKANCVSFTKEISEYIMIAVYRMFRVIYSANDKNQSKMFKVPEHVAGPYCVAAQEKHFAAAKSIAEGKPVEGMEKLPDTAPLALSTESITNDYPLYGTSLLNLIHTAENAIEKE